MSDRDDPSTRPALERDANLDRLQQVEGYKVLPPCVLYGKIGQGGMGAVYRGRHLNLDIDVAVKCLKPDLTGDDEQFVVRFRREARSAARINHQNVVRVFDVSEEKGLHYIVMELVQGETARQRVQRKQQLAVGEALEILFCAAEGLGEAHSKGFIHRDVKPDNIMIAQNGQVKVADLGLAKPTDNHAMSLLSGTNVVMGTPQYMPPEQWENTATVTPAADVWALGATLYYLLVGGEAIAKDSLPRIMQRIVLQPFPDVREQRPDVPDDVAALIAKATARAPEDRYADAREMAAAIGRLQTRRESLRDMRTTINAEHNTLLSPPPAKTLAKIKFWLDEQAHGGGGAGGDGTAVGGRTVVMPAPDGRATGGTTGATATRARARGPLVAVVALLVIALAALAYWQPWRGGDPFAESERLARAGQYQQAIRVAQDVYAADASLPGRAERIARLHAEWASVLLDQDRLQAALERIEESLANGDSERARDVRRAAHAKAALRIERDLQREAPGGEPLPKAQPVTFQGRLGSLLVRELRIAGVTAAIAGDGTFSVTVDLRGAEQVEVVAVLKAGGEVALRPWAVRYAADDATPKPVDGPVGTAPEATQPGATEPAVVEPVAPAVAEPGPVAAKPKPLAETVAVAPTSVELVGDADGELTIDAPADAALFVDGRRIDRGGRERYVHTVATDAPQPAPVEVRVQREGEPEYRVSVAVTRVERALRFAAGPTFVDVPRAESRWVTATAAVTLRGRLSERSDRLLVNGAVAPDVQWRDDEFTVTVALAEVGANVIRLEAQRKFCRSATNEQTVYRVPAPTVRLARDTQLRAQVGVGSYEVCVQTDEWARSVTAGGVALQRDGELWRGAVALAVGENVVPVVVRNVLDQQASLQLVIERLAASAPPELRAVSLRVGDELRVIASRSQVFVRGDAVLVLECSDPDAEVLLNDEPVARTADGCVDLLPILGEERLGRVTLALQNGAGKSSALTFFAMRDSAPPVVEVTAPRAAVPKGKPFELRGTWADEGGLRLDGSKLGELDVWLSSGGINKKGTWKVTHPGLDETTELELVVTDRAGNERRLPVRVEVQ